MATCTLCGDRRGIYLTIGYEGTTPKQVLAVCPECNADGAAEPDLPEWRQADEPKLSENDGPVHWCQGCYSERVAFDWREDRQLCARCKAEEATHGAR